MDGYKNYNNDDYNNGFPDNANYNPNDFTPQPPEGNEYYDPNDSGYGNLEFVSPEFADLGFGGQASTPENNDFNFAATEYDNAESGNGEYSSPEYTDVAYNEQQVYSQQYIQESIFTPLYPEGDMDLSAATMEFPTTEPSAAATDMPVSDTPAQVKSDPLKELTDAELADLKRQKQAERRKKLAARERRRKKRRQQAIIRCSILLAIVILLIVGLVKLISGIWNHFDEEKKAKATSEYIATSEVTTEEPVAEIDDAIVAKEIPTDRETAMELIKQQAETDTDMKNIYDNAATLPDVVIKHLAANSELKEFAIKYAAKINIVFDGNFTLDVTEGEVPLYLQYDERWGYADYATDLVGLHGSGPTALSMAYTYLKKDGSMNPIKIADYATEKQYVDTDGKTKWTLITEGTKELGLLAEDLNVNKDDMIKALKDGKLIICQMASGDFTTDQNYIIIRDYKDGFFYVNDPTSEARSKVGWDYKRLSKQIAQMSTLEAGAVSNTEDTGTTQEGSAETSSETSNSTENTSTTENSGSSETGSSQSNLTGNEDSESNNY